MAAMNKQNLIVPPFVQPGDQIGVMTPASPYPDQALRKGIELLRDWGFRVVLGRKRISRKGYLAGTDQERADELHALLTDPDIKALMCSRGGYGAMRILDLLDYQEIKRNPKLVMGFSDITALLLALWKKIGLMTFHGPMVTTLPRSNLFTKSSVQAVLKGHYQIELPLDKRKAVIARSTEGVLIGGNLTLITHLIGTHYEPVWDRAILFLEDCGEEPYRLDRMFQHLRLRGCFSEIAAIILGRFSRSDGKEIPLKKIIPLLEDLQIPIWTSLPVGHGASNVPLPIGAPAFLDSRKGRLSVTI
jgi:muramoyltetrapeptide carboxypeptidase